MTEEKQTSPPKQIKDPEPMREVLRTVDNMQEIKPHKFRRKSE